MLLAIDTSAGTSVAVVDAGRVLGSADEADTRGHAEAIGRLIVDALAQAGAAPAEITGVVAGMGPGPFTGLRVGIAAARAFAAGRGIPVHPVASHDAVAFGTHGPDADGGHRRPAPRGRLDRATSTASRSTARTSRARRLAAAATARATAIDAADQRGIPRACAPSS